MRDVEFKAWDKELNRMCDVIQLGIKDIIVKSKDEDEVSGYLPRDRFILLQYTGLKDKNKEKIYESYIMEHKNPKPFKKSLYKVVYSCGGFAIENDDYIEDLNEFLKGSSSAKIIGNIFENPELLEVR